MSAVHTSSKTVDNKRNKNYSPIVQSNPYLYRRADCGKPMQNY